MRFKKKYYLCSVKLIYRDMIRYAIDQLKAWVHQPNRKPLILQGARQVGKTWLMKQFAAECFEHSVYVNFENNQLLEHLFEKDFDMDRILLELQIATHTTITPNTLLLFDELQEVKRGVTALKYFQELLPEQPIIAAGSLLGIAMHRDDSFPVGKVDFLTLYPMSFFEFAEAMGEQLLVKQLRDQRWEIINKYASRLETLLRQYFYVGGMPEVVSAFVQNKDFVQVRMIQQAILDSYDHDFSKHAPVREVPRIRMIWRSVSGQLSKENKKFIYGFLKQGARAKDFELALSWLQDAGLIYKVHRTKAGRLPLSAYEDFSAFKVFLLDVGLLGALSGVEPQMMLEENELFKEFKGALTEQYVMQQLRTNRQNMIYYWSQDNSQGEIDFLVQQGVRIHPIEVKAEENLQSKSLRWFVEHNTGLRGVRFSMSGYRDQDWLTNYPLYSVEAIM